MSDIGMPAGFNLFVISVFAATVCLGLMLGLLLVNFFVQRGKNFARRTPFRMLIGTLLPLALALLAAFFTDSAPYEWRGASDRLNELWYVAVYLATLALGWALALRA